MEKCSELLYGNNCIIQCIQPHGIEHSHHDMSAENYLKSGYGSDVSNRPILENGVSYELEVAELKSIQGLYFCDECNSFHVSEDHIQEFTKKYS